MAVRIRSAGDPADFSGAPGDPDDLGEQVAALWVAGASRPEWCFVAEDESGAARPRGRASLRRWARCCRCIDVAPTALPFNIKSASVGEGQTPVSLSCVEDDGLGEELRVLLAHSMRTGHHQLPRPGGMTRRDPVG